MLGAAPTQASSNADDSFASHARTLSATPARPRAWPRWIGAASIVVLALVLFPALAGAAAGPQAHAQETRSSSARTAQAAAFGASSSTRPTRSAASSRHTAHRAAAHRTKLEVPPRLWAVQVSPGGRGWFDRALLMRVSQDGINALILRISALGRKRSAKRTFDSVRRFAAAGKLYLIAVLPAGKPRTPAARHVVAACSSRRFSRLRCAVHARSAAAAARLAGKGSPVSQFVAVYVKGPRRFSGPAEPRTPVRRRILAIAPLPESFDASAWGAAIGQTAASTSVNMGVAPDTRQASPAVEQFAAMLAGESGSSGGVNGGGGATSPSTPTGLATRSVTQTSLTLSWSTSTGSVGVAGYRLFRNGTQVGTSTSTSYSFTGLACGASYTLGVAAYDAAGDASGTAIVGSSTSACSDRQPPSTPTGLATSSVAQTSMSMSWNASTDNVGVAGYRLFLNGSQVGTSTSTGFSFSGLSCGTSYTLGGAAYDAAGNASGTATVVQTTAACGPPSPAQANLWVSSTGKSSCIRSATPVTYSSGGSTDCGSFDAAYQAASDGDTVLVRNGTYGKQAFTSRSTAGWSQGVTFRAENALGATVEAQSSGTTLSIGTASWITLDGFDLNGYQTQCPKAQQNVYPGCGNSYGIVTDSTAGGDSHITIEDSQVDVGKLNGGGSMFFLYKPQNWRITGNTFGPSCCGADSVDSPVAITIGKPSNGANDCAHEGCNVQIDHNVFRYADLRHASDWPTSGWGSAPEPSCTDTIHCHLDALHIGGLIGGQIDSNQFLGDDCEDIYMEGGGYQGNDNRNIDIVGNTWSAVSDHCNGGLYVKCAGSGTCGGTWNVGFNEGNDLMTLGTGWAGAESGTVVNIYGNYTYLMMANSSGNNAGCMAGTTGNVTINYQYNVWRGLFGGGGNTAGPCAPTDTVATTPGWVNAVGAPATGLDMHKTGPAGVADDFVPCASLTIGSCPATDYDGDSFGPFADAGADQRSTSSTGAVSGASLASCSPVACTDPGYAPDASTVSCPNTVESPVIDTADHVVTLGAISNGSGNECRQYGYFVPTNLNTGGGATGSPAALLYAGNPAPATCGPSGNSEIHQVFTESEMAPLAVANHFIGIALAKSCNPQATSWRHPYIDQPAGGTTPNDDAYLEAVVSDIEARWHVDPNRIYLVGSSSGGGLVNGAACDPAVSGLFRGYAPNANYMQTTGNTTTGANPGTERCGSSNTNFFYFTPDATGDMQVPAAGTCLPTHCVDSYAANLSYWQNRMGCSSTPATSSFGAPTAVNVHTAYSGCTFGLTPAVAGDLVHGGSHGIPAITSTAYGGICTNCNDYYAIRETWNFFASSKWVP